MKGSTTPSIGEADCGHPVVSLMSVFSSSLPFGWSLHRLSDHPLSFVLARAGFDFSSWTTSWQQTVLFQFKNIEKAPTNASDPSFPCELFRKTPHTVQSEPEFLMTLSLSNARQVVQLLQCFDGTRDSLNLESDDPAERALREKMILKCFTCGTTDAVDWTIDAQGTPTCAACQDFAKAKISEKEVGFENSAKEPLTSAKPPPHASVDVGATVVGSVDLAKDGPSRGVDSNVSSKNKHRKKNRKKPGRKPKTIFCPLCTDEFRTNQNYVDHILLKHNEESAKFRCDYPECDKAYPKKQTLKIHQAQVHGVGETPFSCEKCHKHFATLGTLHSHERAVHSTEIKFSCGFCGRGFTSKGKHNLHVKVRHSNSRPFECESCNKKFPLKCILKRHIQDAHTKNKPFKCQLCSYATVNNRDLTKHEQAVHQGKRDHVCESCTMQFFNRSGLLRHKRTVHELRKDYKCDFCEKKFAEKRNMESHRRIHTGEKKYTCNWCDYKCVDKSNLSKHVKKHAENLCNS